jgi:hypothetical protein
VDQGKCFRLIQGGEAEIYVKVRPVKVIPVKKLDIQNLINCCGPEPRELFIGKEVLLVLKQEPETKSIDIGHFNLQNACAKRPGCNFSFPPPFSSIPISESATDYGFWLGQPSVPARIWLLRRGKKHGHGGGVLPGKRFDGSSVCKTGKIIDQIGMLSRDNLTIILIIITIG